MSASQEPKKTFLSLGNLPPRQTPGDVQKQGAQFPRTPSRVNPNAPPWPAFRGYHNFSFARDVMTKRLPTILSKGIQDVYLTLNQESEEEVITDLVECVHRMDKLMEDLQGEAILRPIIDDGAGDIPLWNKEIARYFQGKSFTSAPWLFAEAYKYRRLRECFSMSKHWKEYDIFFRQKCDTFSRSSQAVFELSMRFSSPFVYEDGMDEDKKKAKDELTFLELTQICLWGNSTDLSLLIDMTEEDIKKLQSTGAGALEASSKNILGNHSGRLWELVSKMKGSRIDFVLDNAGFELYCDLVYADWLIQSGKCAEIRFHGKTLPWFVSDVTKKDWHWLLNTCVYGQLFPDASDDELESLRVMGRRWKSYVADGIWKYEQHAFWCSGYTFWELIDQAPDLFLNLSKSNLVIYKGDLNHRKLTYDCQAPPTTPFDQAIGSLASSAGAPPVLSLRTIKSDVVVGVPEGVAEKLDEEKPGWRISGEYAIILLSDGRPGEKVVFAA